VFKENAVKLYTKLLKTKFLENFKIFSDCSVHGFQLCSIKKFLSDINNLYNLENNTFLSSLIKITIFYNIFYDFRLKLSRNDFLKTQI